MTRTETIHAKVTSSTVSSTTWRILFILLILGFVWRAYFIYREVDWIADYWLFEDFGYSLKIAKNIAIGLGETFDGVVPTNGYQPLYVWIMVPIFRIFKTDIITPLYIAVTLLAVANVATAYFIFRIVKRITDNDALAITGVVFWIFNLAIAKNGSNGLEAGLATMMIAVTLDYFLRLQKLTTVKAIQLGVLLGISFLTRVDAIFLIGIILFLTVSLDASSLFQRIKFSVTTFVVFIIISMPYVVWNLTKFGSAIPSSGLVTTGKSSFLNIWGKSINDIAINIEHGTFVIGNMILGKASTTGYVWPPVERDFYIIALTAVLLVLVGLACAMWRTRENVRFTTVLFGVILLYSWGYMVYSFVPFERYFLPVILCFCILFAAGLRFVKRLMVIFIIVVGIFSLHIYNALPYIYTMNLYTAGWYAGIKELNKISKKGDVVAGHQSGNLGYFYENGRAINLDGVVNMEAHHYRKSGEIDHYIYDNNVKYLADAEGWIYIIADQINSLHDRRMFYANMIQRHASADYDFSVYELTDNVYTEVNKLPASGLWEKIEQFQFIDKFGLMSSTPGSRVEFIAGGCFEIKFLRHDWSGIVDVYKDGDWVRRVDLFSEVYDPTWREYFFEDSGPHVYVLEVSEHKNPISLDTQVWVDAILIRGSCK